MRSFRMLRLVSFGSASDGSGGGVDANSQAAQGDEEEAQRAQALELGTLRLPTMAEPASSSRRAKSKRGSRSASVMPSTEARDEEELDSIQETEESYEDGFQDVLSTSPTTTAVKTVSFPEPPSAEREDESSPRVASTPTKEGILSAIRSPRSSSSFAEVSGGQGGKDETREDEDEPSCWRDFVRRALCVYVVMCLGASFTCLFTLGWFGAAESVYLALLGFTPYQSGILTATLGLCLAFALLDIDAWHGWIFGTLSNLCSGLLMALVVSSLLSNTAYFPASSILAFFLVSFASVVGTRRLLLRDMPRPEFLRWIAAGMMITGVASGTQWIVWLVTQEKWWTDPDLTARIEFYQRLQCLSSTAVLPKNRTLRASFLNSMERNGNCDEAFVAWVSPLILCVFCVILSLFCFVVLRVLEETERQVVVARQPRLKRMDAVTRLFLLSTGISLCAVWAAAGIAGDEIGMSSIVLALSLLGFVFASAVLLFVLGETALREELLHTPLIRSLSSTLESDWLRALFVLGFLPFSVVVFPVSAIRQCGRKHLAFTRPLSLDKLDLFYTPNVARALKQVGKWSWTSVWRKVIYWSIAFFVMNVLLAKYANVFFAWLDVMFVRAGLGVAAVSVIFVLVGIVCFLIPVVPGLPVYLSAGVVIVEICVRQGGWDLWVAWIYSTALSLFMKLVSNAIVQICIGQAYGSKSVKLRKLVAINSIELRAIRRIFTEPGVTFNKTAVLVGGPDFPTAFIAGVVRSSLFYNCVGTLSCLIVIVPVTLSGTLLLNKSRGGVWASGAAVCLSLAGVAQIGSTILAAHVIQGVLDKHREDLEKDYPIDEQVAQLDRLDEVARKRRERVARFKLLPTWLKIVLISGVLAGAVSVYVFQFASSSCFVPFEITDDFFGGRLQGNPVNLVVWPLGYVALGLFLWSVLVLWILSRWTTKRVRLAASDGGVVPEGGETEEEEEDLDEPAGGARGLARQRSGVSDATSEFDDGNEYESRACPIF